MQKYTRILYAKIVCDNTIRESSDKYLERCALVYRIVDKVLPDYRKYLQSTSAPDIIASVLRYTKTQNMTLCIYQGYFFLGFSDLTSNIKAISFTDKSNKFTELQKSDLETLGSRLLNAIQWHSSKATDLCNKMAAKPWEDMIPLLDKIITFEERIKSLPEDVLHKFRERLLYDECIDVIISTGTGFSPNLEEEIEKRISQAFKIAGKSEIEEPGMSLR